MGVCPVEEGQTQDGDWRQLAQWKCLSVVYTQGQTLKAGPVLQGLGVQVLRQARDPERPGLSPCDPSWTCASGSARWRYLEAWLPLPWACRAELESRIPAPGTGRACPALGTVASPRFSYRLRLMIQAENIHSTNHASYFCNLGLRISAPGC